MIKLLMSIILFGLSVPVVSADDTGYISSSEFQNEFDEFVRLGYFPSVVIGKVTNEGKKFRGIFEPIPNTNFSFATRHGALSTSFSERNTSLISLGFQLMWVHTFLDNIGRIRYQATWVKGNNSVIDCLNQRMFWYEGGCHTENYTNSEEINTTAPNSNIGTVSSNLDIHMPSLNYQSLFGIQNIWADFEYLGENLEGKHTWELKNFGVNQ